MLRTAKAKQALWCALLAAAALFLCSKSSPLFVLNDWMDANIFFTMGKSMFEGKVLYRDVFDHKGPVLYLLYGLGWLLDHTGFTGVWLLEVAAFACFLFFSLRTVSLFLPAPLCPAWAAVPAAVIAASRAFSHGGSAEEFLLPFLAAALYCLLRALQTGRQVPLWAVCIQGALAGCALWLKYTVLGFYLAWVLVLTVWYVRHGWQRALAQSCGAYLGGVALATLPWAVWSILGRTACCPTGSPSISTITCSSIRAAAARWILSATCGGRCGTRCPVWACSCCFLCGRLSAGGGWRPRSACWRPVWRAPA